MTRIISGFAGSLPLQVPRSGTRPTSDRTREGIFSALEARDAIDGAAVLDLFAGSGALGLEAISRGAASAVLVERSAEAAGVCRKNAARIRAALPTSAPVDVVTRSVGSYLQTVTKSFDLVFLDPPYDIAETEITTALELLVGHLEDEAEIVLERSVRSPAPTWPAEIELTRSREYGETVVHYATTR